MKLIVNTKKYQVHIIAPLSHCYLERKQNICEIQTLKYLVPLFSLFSFLLGHLDFLLGKTFSANQ